MKNLLTCLIMLISICYYTQAQVGSLPMRKIENIYQEKEKQLDSTESKRKSPFKNFWVQAKLAANLQNLDESNMTPSSKLVLAEIDQFRDHKFLRLWVTGNIGQIKDPNDSTFKEGLNAILDSDNGLNIGLTPIILLTKDNDNGNYFNLFAHVGYKFNSISYVPKGETESVIEPFGQAKVSVGLQFDGWKITGDSGETFTFSIEGSLALFSESKYNRIYGEEKKSLTSLSTSLIVPLGRRIGLQLIADFNTETDPILRSGLIFKASDL